MSATRRAPAGFSLIEVMIVLAITLILGAVVYQATSASLRLYRTVSHQTERGLSGLRALDDMAVDIARAGFGLSDDLARITPGATPDEITVRSNPSGLPGVDREVRFRLVTDRTGATAVARTVTGQAEQILARHVAFLRFDYLDAMGDPLDTSRDQVRAVRIGLGLAPDPAGPPVSVPPLTLVVALEPQSATVAIPVGPVFPLVGVTAIVGQDTSSLRKAVRLRAWRKADGT